MEEYIANKIPQMNMQEIATLCEQIRQKILEVVSTNGGHLSSTLGAVEVIVAMHYVFDCKANPFIFDVSHQAYAHKLLTGRWNEFSSLRQFGGISGFCNPRESDLYYFIAGHSSTSISLGVGLAKAIHLEKRQGMPIVFIGDGSMSAGLVYEALNELGDRKYPMLIILNDNEMSIAKPIGAISKYLSQITSHPMYQSFRSATKKFLGKMPDSATYLAKRFEESLKLITPGILFEELGVDYIGPIDGHNVEELILCFKRAKELKKPVMVHIQTIKGKGYKIAEGPYEKWHGVGPFDIQTGKSLKKASISPTQVYSDTLLSLADKDERIVGVTAAMPGGVGLGQLIDKYPDRFWDVGIAEQHAVTSMAALAKEGFKPFVSIYSTFLQRAFDQIIHDVGIMCLPVRFSIDRAGIVGEDGETHQGLFDIAYLRIIPGFTLFAPRDNATLQKAIEYAYKHCDSPCAYRYPRGQFILNDGIFKASDFVLGECEVLQNGVDILLIGYGNGVGRAYLVCEELKKLGLNPTLLDLRFVSPLPLRLKDYLLSHTHIFIFSDSYKSGGVGSAIGEFMASCDIVKPYYSLEIESQFVRHGDVKSVERFLGIDTISLVDKITAYIQSDKSSKPKKI